jgi:hypothetical protein
MPMKRMLLLMACLVLQSNGATLSAFHLGNSLTDQFDGIPDIARSKGDSLHQKRMTVPGAGIEYLWHNTTLPTDLNSSWDILNTLAFCNGSELGVNNDAKYIGLYYDKALSVNPNTKLVVFAQWWDTAKVWETVWHSSLDTSKPGYAQPYGSAAYHQTLTTKLRTMYPTKEVVLVPVGHVLDSFEHKAAKGEIPGFTRAHDLYADGIHLNSSGKYLQNITGYAVYFKKDPHGAGLSFSQWSGTESVSQSFANIAADIVWGVVRNLSAYTGVTSTDVKPVARSANRLIDASARPGELFSITGRLVGKTGTASTPSAAVLVDGRTGARIVRLK